MSNLNALTTVGALMTLIDFTLSNARRFYSSMGNPLAAKGLIQLTILATIQCNAHTSQLSNVLFGMNAYEMCPRVIQSYVCAVDVRVGPKLRKTKICIIEQNLPTTPQLVLKAYGTCQASVYTTYPF